VPPAGGFEATGTTNIDILEKYASAQVQAGVKEADRLIAEAKKLLVETLRTVRMSDSEEVTGYFRGDKLVKRHGITKLFTGGKKYAEEEYQDGKKVHSGAFSETDGRLMVESWFRGDDEFKYQETSYSWDGKIEFEKRRLDKDSKWQIKTSTGEWFDQ
jgi:hypothetical protein